MVGGYTGPQNCRLHMYTIKIEIGYCLSNIQGKKFPHIYQSYMNTDLHDYIYVKRYSETQINTGTLGSFKRDKISRNLYKTRLT